MKLHHRILLAQLPALLVIVILFAWGERTVARLGAESQRILAQNYRSVLAAERMKESIERLDSAALFRVAGETDRADALVSRHRPLFEAELRAEEGNITEPGEIEAAASLRAGWTAYQGHYDAFSAAGEGDARAVYFLTLLPSFQRVHADAAHVLTLNQDAMLRKSDQAAASADAARRAWLGWSILGLIGAISLGAWVSHRLTVPLRALSVSAEAVGTGNLDVHLPMTDVHELDALAEAFNVMASRLRLYRRANDSELSRARESAQAAIESLEDPVLVLTLRGELRASNGAARRVLGLTARARRLDAVDPSLQTAIEAAQSAVLEGGKPALPVDYSGVVVVPTADGERALLPHATPINDAVTGELVGVTVLLQDVTRLRRLDELKGNLVQTVAHELRTPLTSLGMALHLVLDERVSGPLTPRVTELLAAAREDVARLRALVEDLLDLSRIQEGRIVLRREVVAPGALLADAADALQSAATAAGVVLVAEPAPDVPAVSLDRGRVLLALTNLVTNAIRHSPRGGTVALRAQPTADHVRFEVDDSGPGVPIEDRARIFEAFVRGADETGIGAGLGLTIVREVARAHGGQVGVDASASGGARFWIELPR